VNEPRVFYLRRNEDPTGISGTGIVAWGIRFNDGKVVTRWCSDTKGVNQTCLWDSMEHVEKIHGHGGQTEIVWLCPDVTAPPFNDVIVHAPHYTSTYCLHDAHEHCRLTCKLCSEPCRCSCHRALKVAA
jgi:hypothetical protein